LALRIFPFAWLACAALWGSPATADTLPQAVTRALASLPEIRAARANQRAIEENAAQARGAWLPVVDASLGHGREHSTNPSTRALGSDPTLTRREAEIMLSQLLFGTSASIRGARTRGRGSGLDRRRERRRARGAGLPGRDPAA
jgi:outer membrane protein TolC